MQQNIRSLSLLLAFSPVVTGCGEFARAEDTKRTNPATVKSAPASTASLSAQQRVLTRAGARTAIDTALAEATRRGVTVAISVVDAGGHLIAAERVDGTFFASPHISEGKARTAVAFKHPTSFFEKVIRDGRTPMVALGEGFTPLQGGVPIELDGQILGGVGASGASSAAEDEELATLAMNAVLAALRKQTLALGAQQAGASDHAQAQGTR